MRRTMKNMDVSSLREQYKNSRDSQKKHTQVLLFNTASEELSDTVSIIPIAQGLTSPPPDITFIPRPDPSMTFDPWHIHLDHHRRSCSSVTVPIPLTSISCSSRCSSSSSSSSSSSESTVVSSDSLSSCRDLSPCSAPCSTTEQQHTPSAESSVCGSGLDPVSASLGSSQQNPHVRPRESPSSRTLTHFDVTTVACNSPWSSTSTLHPDLKTIQSTTLKTRTRTSSSISKQMKKSVSTEDLSSWVHLSQNQSQNKGQNQIQNKNYYPFPSRKPQRISETARKLGMYSAASLSK